MIKKVFNVSEYTLKSLFKYLRPHVQGFYWRIYLFDGRVNKESGINANEIYLTAANWPHGFELDSNFLFKLMDNLLSLDDIILVGNDQPILLSKNPDDWNTKNQLVVELFDSSEWIITTYDPEIMRVIELNKKSNSASKLTYFKTIPGKKKE